MTVTAGDLLADEAVRGGTTIGGLAGLDAVVHHVALVTDGSELDEAPYGTAAVLDLGGPAGATHRQHLAELVCRRLYSRGGRLLVAAGGPLHPALSTVRLADRFGLPVVAVPNAAPHELAARLLAVVRQPELSLGRRLASGAARLRTAGSLDRIVEVLADTLDGRAAMITADGTSLTGSPPRHPFAVPSGTPVPTADRTGRVSTAMCPVPGTQEGSRLWLVCQSETSGPLWRDTALGLLDIAAAYAGMRFATERLDAERDARIRGGLLTELLNLADGPPPAHVTGRSARLGWRLDGWHTGIHIALLGTTLTVPTALTPVLGAELTEHGVHGPLVERADGWSAWHTDEVQPTSTTWLSTAVERALAGYHRHADVPPIVAGLGPPSAGPAGIAATLGEAQRAAAAATVPRHPGTVQRSDELGTKRMLLDWYASPAIRDEAAQMLAPLVRAGDEDLLDTVESYLDHDGSASHTAQRLGLHRNTVTRRIRRAEELLGIPLSDPDDRLAVHLACRMRRLAEP